LRIRYGLLDGGTLNNSGASDGVVKLEGRNGAILNNLSTGTLDVRLLDVGYLLGAEPVLNNSGLVRAQGSSSAQASGYIGWVFNNAGTVTVENASLYLDGGGSATGTFNVGAGARLQFDSGYVLHPGSAVTGQGDVAFLSGTTAINGAYTISGQTRIAGSEDNPEPPVVLFNTDTTLGALSIEAGGTLVASFGNVTVNGLLDCEGGTIAGPGTVNANGGLKLRADYYSETPADLRGKIVNNAGASVGPVIARGSYGVVINNLASGTLDIGELGKGDGQTPVLNNSGLVRAQGSSSDYVTGHIDWVFNNAGSVTVSNATLYLRGGGTSTGKFTVDAGELGFDGGDHVLSPSSVVSGAGDVSVTSGSVTFGGLYNVSGTIVSGKNTTVAFNGDASTESLSIEDGATLTGAGTLTVADHMSLASVTLSGSGQIIAAGGLGIWGTPVLDARTLANTSDAECEADSLVGRNGAVINNLADAAFEVDESTTFAWDGGARPVFNNAGTFRKTEAGHSDTATIDWAFNNTGLVEVASGTLRLQGGGTNTGEFDVRSGAYLAFSGGEHVFGAGSYLHGDGIVKFEGGTVNFAGDYHVVGTTYIEGGTVNVNSSLAAIMMVFSAGTVGGNGGVAALGQIVWSGGTFTGKGRLYSPLLLSISRTDAKLLDGWTINSSGKAVWWNGAAVSMQNGAAFNNSGDFEAIGDGVFSYSPVGAEAVFNNSGRFVKSAGIGAIKFDGVRFNNTGSVQVRSGRLELLGPVTQFVAGTLTGGEWDVYDGATLVFSTSGVGVIRNQAKVSLHGAGSVFGHLNALAENQGSLAIMEGRSFSTAASLRNSGTLTIGAGSSLTINGPFINTGIVNSMGTLSVAASGERAAAFAADQPAGSLTISGNITNAGLMNLNGGLGASGLFTNTGTLSISGQQDWKGDPLLVVDGGKLVLASNAGTLDQPVLQIQLLNQGQATFASPQHLKSLGISSGVAALFPGGDNVLRTGQLSLAGPSSLDLADNAMIVQSTSSTREAILSQITEWVGLGRNSPSGLWTGPGITSSAAGADSRHMTALGVALNDKGLGRDTLFYIFAGQPVDIDCILVRYTWNGDANLDGVVNADDYFRIDSGFITQEEGYYNGDFNYDGVVNADDYFLIDSAFLGQTGPLSASTAGPRAPAVAVPEPSTGAVLCGAIVAALVTGQRGLIRRR